LLTCAVFAAHTAAHRAATLDGYIDALEQRRAQMARPALSRREPLPAGRIVSGDPG
jgi:hypothetical protein